MSLVQATAPTTAQVLVVDDDLLDQKRYQRYLSKQQPRITVATAANGRLGIDAARKLTPECILLDHNLPDMSGIDFLKRLNEAVDVVPAVVMLTGAGNEQVAVNAMKSGAQDYLSKDSLTPELLMQAIDGAVQLVALKRKVHEQQVALARTVSSLEKSNRDLVEARYAADAANRAKSEFLACMSHELRTPLNSIMVLAQLLTTDASESVREYGENIFGSGRELLTIIDDLIDLARIESGNLETRIQRISVVEFVDNIEREFAGSCRDKGLTLTALIADGVPQEIDTDAQRSRQIIRNFMTNAVKFTEAGSVDFSVRQVKTDGQDEVAFAVRDTGIGIAQDQQELVFDSFKQVDGSIQRKYNGSGLGLAISRKLAGLLHGRVALESQENIGSVFTLYLPTDMPQVEHDGW